MEDAIERLAMYFGGYIDPDLGLCLEDRWRLDAHNSPECVDRLREKARRILEPAALTPTAAPAATDTEE